MHSPARSTAFGLAALLLPLAALAEPRTFTSADGRTVEAEIIAATADSVSLKLAGGQTVVSTLDRFSVADRQFIAAWLKQNPAKINYSFQVSYTKDKTGSSKQKGGSVSVTAEFWQCRIKLANRSGQDLDNVEVNYNIFYEQMDEGRPVLRSSRGKVALPKIRANEELNLLTDEIQLTSTQLAGGYYYIGGARARQKDSLAGMAVSIQHAGKTVFTWASKGMEGKAGTATGTTGSLSRP